MRPLRRALVALLVPVLLAVASRAGHAAGSQLAPRASGIRVPAGCTYDRCALGARGAMRGAAEPRIGYAQYEENRRILTDAGGDVALELALARRAARREMIYGSVGLAGLLGTWAYYTPKHAREWRPALGVGLPLMVVATSVLADVGPSALDHERRAVWLYNGALPDDSGAVASSCAYDRCGLYLQGRALVRGAHATRVSGLGGRGPDAGLFAEAGDSARVHFAAYRDARRGSATAMRIVLGSVVGAGVVAGSVRNRTGQGVALGLLATGYAVGHLSLGNLARERDELERAIWFYNRTLPRAP